MHANKNDELLPVYLESFCVCSFAYSAMSNVINSTSLCWIEPKYNEYVYVCVRVVMPNYFETTLEQF